MGTSRRDDDRVPEPPTTLAIVIACIAGVLVLCGVVGALSLLS
jgi:hypothetical protein